MERDNSVELIQRARAGEQDAVGLLLEKHRPWLHILASRALDPIVSARLSGSDIVQQTCLEAHRDFHDFQGQTGPELIGWLQQILRHNVLEATQVHVRAHKRSVHREQADIGCEEHPAVSQSSPSSRAMRSEQAVQLARAMRELPEDQCEALRLRYLEGWSLREIAERLERSEMAIASLIKRGLQGLRKRLPPGEGG